MATTDPFLSIEDNFPSVNLSPDKTKAIECFRIIEKQIVFTDMENPLLINGIKSAVFQSILTLFTRGINPLAKEILGEYKELTNDIQIAYRSIQPDAGSDWIQECIAFGDKKAFHWEWKHYGSKELF
ncbi:LIC_11502 family protein [Leptospira sp. 'Mane']|uniref:LIC_11502 family protein n=1 Tax=Leptospira sp. 'Mane' TaxID=3387407 RepID=UPI00398BAD9E